MLRKERDAERPASLREPLAASVIAAAVAVMVAAAITATAAVAEAVVPAAATDQDDEKDDPQAGTIVVGQVKIAMYSVGTDGEERRIPWLITNAGIPQAGIRSRSAKVSGPVKAHSKPVGSGADAGG